MDPLIRDITIALISAVLGGGLLTGVAGLWKARQESKRVGTDLNSISIASAEHALIMLKSALEEAEKDLKVLRRERDEERERHRVETFEARERHRVELVERDRRITELEEDLRRLSGLFHDVSNQLSRVLKKAQEAQES